MDCIVRLAVKHLNKSLNWNQSEYRGNLKNLFMDEFRNVKNVNEYQIRGKKTILCDPPTLNDFQKN